MQSLIHPIRSNCVSEMQKGSVLASYGAIFVGQIEQKQRIKCVKYKLGLHNITFMFFELLYIIEIYN